MGGNLLATSLNVLLVLSLFLLSSQGFSQSETSLEFNHFLSDFQTRSQTVLNAQQRLTQAEFNRARSTDFWKSRLEANPEISFLERNFDSGIQPDISNRSQNLTASLTQNAPTGTALTLSGQKYLEVQNPLFSSLDRSYSARLSQDLIRNSFGKTQRAQGQKAESDFLVAQLEYRRSLITSCEESFKLYSETYIQQEIVELLTSQLKEAQVAQKISQKLYNDRLIQKMDQLSSQSDFINTQIQVEQAQQKLMNDKKIMFSFLSTDLPPQANLKSPESFLTKPQYTPGQETMTERIISQQINSQEYDVERARSDRWTDLRLGLEAGERFGRFGFSGPLLNYSEDYLMATLTLGIDIINRTEDADLRATLQIQNNLAAQKAMVTQNQKSMLSGLMDNDQLFIQQIELTETQVKLLKEKMNLAFDQMKRARLDFENYLLHRNSYLNQRMNLIKMKKDFWLNRFAIHKELAHDNPLFCEAQK